MSTADILGATTSELLAAALFTIAYDGIDATTGFPSAELFSRFGLPEHHDDR